jgi:hypothetical protein
MSSNYDATEFVDDDFQATTKTAYAAPASANRAPTREEVDSKVGEAQQKIAELKRAQEELERERAGLEETRRRQIEFQTGRQEMIQHLTRGVGLLEEAEFNARRDAEQMTKSLGDMRDVLAKVQAAREEAWTRDNFTVELTRGLTTIENARMEWNTALLKFPMLTANSQSPAADQPDAKPAKDLFTDRGFFELARLGLALTWPVVVTLAIAGLAIFIAVLTRR